MKLLVLTPYRVAIVRFVFFQHILNCHVYHRFSVSLRKQNFFINILFKQIDCHYPVVKIKICIFFSFTFFLSENQILSLCEDLMFFFFCFEKKKFETNKLLVGPHFFFWAHAIKCWLFYYFHLIKFTFYHFFFFFGK